MNRWRLRPRSERRREATAPALIAINSRLSGPVAPKITPSAAAPAAARSAKRVIETGGNRATASSANRAGSASGWPLQNSSITPIVAATLCMPTPTGAAARISCREPLPSLMRMVSSPQPGKTIALPAGVKVHLAFGCTDMRKGIDGLAMLVQGMLRQDPFSGHLFLFRGRKANLIKIVFWDGTGLCLFTKRLEQGSFLWPSNVEPDGTRMLSPAHLAVLMCGVDLRAPQRQWRPAPGGRSLRPPYPTTPWVPGGRRRSPKTPPPWQPSFPHPRTSEEP